MQINQLDYDIALKIKNRQLYLSETEVKSPTCESMPLSLTISDTTRCNLNCIMCHRTRNFFDKGPKPFLKRFPLTRDLVKLYAHHRNKTLMDFELFEKICRETFPYLFSLTLSIAGEPFMNPHFIKELELIENYKVKLVIFTNATLLPKGKTLLSLLNNLSTLIVSFDGATKRTYERIRKGADFKAVLSNIKRFNSHQDSLDNDRKPRLVFWLTLMRSNIEELPEFIKLAHNLKADAIGLCHMIVFNERMRSESLIYHKELANRYLIESRDLIDKYGLDTYDFPPLFSNKSESITKDVSSLSEPICRFLWSSSFIELNGDVFPCCAPNRRGLLMGNVAKQTFKEIWNGQCYQKLRESFKKGDLFVSCQNCYQRLKDNISDIDSIYFPIFS
ncbi:MAG: radical SAM protein [Candidatus Omnitrophota bacterium]